jgi:hypothetical protein
MYHVVQIYVPRGTGARRDTGLKPTEDEKLYAALKCRSFTVAPARLRRHGCAGCVRRDLQSECFARLGKHRCVGIPTSGKTGQKWGTRRTCTREIDIRLDLAVQELKRRFHETL